jgi:succinate dehydrogenase / fumarate reductase, cytochrome b subunit
MAQATTTDPRSSAPPVRSRSPRGGPPIVRFYRSAVGKKWVMGVTGILLMGFVLVHLIGNLKLYISREEMNLYGEALRDLGGHLVPRTSILWLFRLGLIAAFVLHIHAAVALTVMNRKARPVAYASRRDYVVANYASRTMRWSGVIVALYLLFHLADLAWGNANPDFVRGDPYNNLVYSLQRPAVAALYVVANLALGVHLLHGAWSLFQSLGLNNPKYNHLRARFAQAFTAVVVLGNLSFPVLVQLDVVEPACPGGDPVAECPEDSGISTAAAPNR